MGDEEVKDDSEDMEREGERGGEEGREGNTLTYPSQGTPHSYHHPFVMTALIHLGGSGPTVYSALKALVSQHRCAGDEVSSLWTRVGETCSDNTEIISLPKAMPLGDQFINICVVIQHL